MPGFVLGTKIIRPLIRAIPESPLLLISSILATYTSPNFTPNSGEIKREPSGPLVAQDDEAW